MDTNSQECAYIWGGGYIVVMFKHFKIKFVKVHIGQPIQVFIGRIPVDVGIAMLDRFNVVNET